MIEALALLLWGTVVGLDLVSVGQVMINRPIVAATVAGAILGDPQAGLAVGVILELFALEILPFGPVKYPDYGVGAVIGAFAAHGAPLVFGVGFGVAVGIVVALAGEASVQVLRRLNTRDVHLHERELDLGSYQAVSTVHRRGIVRDALRAALLTGGGLTLALLLRAEGFMDPRTLVSLHVAVIGVGLGIAATAGVRAARARSGLVSFGVGLAIGILWMVAS